MSHRMLKTGVAIAAGLFLAACSLAPPSRSVRRSTCRRRMRKRRVVPRNGRTSASGNRPSPRTISRHRRGGTSLDPCYDSPPLPVTTDYLRKGGLSERFIAHLRGWPNFVVPN